VEMARGGFVQTDLLPADVTSDPLGHLLGKLPPGHALAPPLRRLRQLLAAADEHPVGDTDRLVALRAARELADEICLVSRPLSLDVAADGDIAIPASLLDEAARTAAALGRAITRPAALADWHEQFVKRHGPDRLVPLLEATDTATGLGIDTEDVDAATGTGAHDGKARAAGHRDGIMATLIADAIAHGRSEGRPERQPRRLGWRECGAVMTAARAGQAVRRRPSRLRMCAGVMGASLARMSMKAAAIGSGPVRV